MSDLILRALTGQEPDIEQLLDDIDAVLQAAYRAPSWKFRVQRFLRVQPGGLVVAQQENEVVAVGGCSSAPAVGSRRTPPRAANDVGCPDQLW